ncbi:hypothetical protein AAG906_013228 [Vitis piasezkii]
MTNTRDDEITLVREEQQLGDLKHEVRRELIAAASNASQQLNVALRFRLLRQQWYNISCEVFNKCKDEKGRFKESLTINDACGLLGLHEATHLRFCFHHLSPQLYGRTFRIPSLAAQVTHALDRPIRKGLERLEARPLMSIYQDEATHSKALLRFAKLDFNLLQSLYNSQIILALKFKLKIYQVFYVDFSSKLPFSRDRVVETYFWTATSCFEPQYSYARRIQTKVVALLTTIDDIFDAYGTVEEPELFIDAIQRWDMNSIHLLENPE